MNKYYLNNNYKLVFESPNDDHSYFYGYYDKSPLSIDNKMLLVHRISFDGREVKDGDVAEVGFFHLESRDYKKIDETLAWNWQQGSHLQWMPPDYNSRIIYNKIINNKFVSIIYNVISEKKDVIPFPIYSVHPNGKEALAVNYERHYWCRPGYNYQNIKNKKFNTFYHPDDGIYRIVFNGKSVKQIVSIKDIINVETEEDMLSTDNWLEHIMYNPSGKRFMLIHRRNVNGRDISRVFSADSTDGKDLFLYPNTKFYSHHFWKSDEELSIWTKIPKTGESQISKASNVVRNVNIIKPIIKPFYLFLLKVIPIKFRREIQNIPKLLLFKDKSYKYEVLGEECITGNGHQSFSKDNSIILYDTYEDKKNYRNLFQYNLIDKKLKKIGSFYSQYNNTIYRCDLHPRFSFDDKLIILDSAHDLKRKILIITEKKSK